MLDVDLQMFSLPLSGDQDFGRAASTRNKKARIKCEYFTGVRNVLRDNG